MVTQASQAVTRFQFSFGYYKVNGLRSDTSVPCSPGAHRLHRLHRLRRGSASSTHVRRRRSLQTEPGRCLGACDSTGRCGLRPANGEAQPGWAAEAGRALSLRRGRLRSRRPGSRERRAADVWVRPHGDQRHPRQRAQSRPCDRELSDRGFSWFESSRPDVWRFVQPMSGATRAFQHRCGSVSPPQVEAVPVSVSTTTPVPMAVRATTSSPTSSSVRSTSEPQRLTGSSAPTRTARLPFRRSRRPPCCIRGWSC